MYTEIDEILAKKVAGEPLSPQEEQSFAQWLLEPDNAEAYADYVNIWNASGKIVSDLSIDVDAEWETFKQNTQKRKIVKFNFAWVASIAASIALVIGFAVMLQQPSSVEYFADKADTKIILPDSTIVWLNKNTRLAYSEKNHKRMLSLTGEALFKVRANGNEFVVTTPHNVETKVLGTTFNLKAYEKSKYVNLSVIEGKVEFGHKNTKAIVTKGEQSVFNCSQMALQPTDSLDHNAISWHTKQFVFNNKPMQQIVNQLGKFLNKKIVLPNNSQRIPFTGTFDNPTEQNVAEIIATAMNWNYSITDNEIVFSE